MRVGRRDSSSREGEACLVLRPLETRWALGRLHTCDEPMCHTILPLVLAKPTLPVAPPWGSLLQLAVQGALHQVATTRARLGTAMHLRRWEAPVEEVRHCSCRLQPPLCSNNSINNSINNSR